MLLNSFRINRKQSCPNASSLLRNNVCHKLPVGEIEIAICLLISSELGFLFPIEFFEESLLFFMLHNG